MRSYTKLLGLRLLGMNFKNRILALIQPVAVGSVGWVTEPWFSIYIQDIGL